MFPSPRLIAEHPDYGLELEEALEPQLIAAIDQARSAGWDSSAIWPALRSLVSNLERAEIENRRTDQAIKDAQSGVI